MDFSEGLPRTSLDGGTNKKKKMKKQQTRERHDTIRALNNVMKKKKMKDNKLYDAHGGTCPRYMQILGSPKLVFEKASWSASQRGIYGAIPHA